MATTSTRGARPRRPVETDRPPNFGVFLGCFPLGSLMAQVANPTIPEAVVSAGCSPTLRRCCFVALFGSGHVTIAGRWGPKKRGERPMVGGAVCEANTKNRWVLLISLSSLHCSSKKPAARSGCGERILPSHPLRPRPRANTERKNFAPGNFDHTRKIYVKRASFCAHCPTVEPTPSSDLATNPAFLAGGHTAAVVYWGRWGNLTTQG